MKTMSSGYGNSGDLLEARQRALAKKQYRYLAIKAKGGNPHAIGGSFTFEILGTNSIEELLKPDVFRAVDEVIDAKTDGTIEKNDLAKRYLESLSRKQRSVLINRMLVDFLIK